MICTSQKFYLRSLTCVILKDIEVSVKSPPVT